MGFDSIELPKSLRYAGEGAFSHCTTLRTITLPEQPDSLGSQLLAYCDALEEIYFPNSLTQIPPAVCYGCPALKSIQIGAHVERIGNEAFALCVGLTNFTSASTTPPDLGNNPFMGVTLGQATLTVPTGARADYEARDVWRDFGSINERSFASISERPSAVTPIIYRSGNQLILDGTTAGETYRLYSLAGEILTQGTTQDGTTTLDVRVLPAGQYVLVVRQDARTITL